MNGIELIVELNQQGFINKDIKKYSGINYSSIALYLKRLGLERNTIKTSQKYYDKLEKMVELNQQGWRNNKISKYLNEDECTIKRYLEDVGLRSPMCNLINREY